LRPGDVQSILGENGAEKSITMNIFYELIPPDSEDIFIFGPIEV
jgi:ABC-type uncharacterized transport system ATPase subunit